MIKCMPGINDYKEEKNCTYKGELYSVRDNGAIMRHRREGKPKRQLDEIWTFGTSTVKGYMEFCGERVHRIVATAFIGEAPSSQHVVDHIDTNRQNNRPDNLQWLTKLENILSNEITRKKVELTCGSIEAFLNDPSLLFGHEMIDSNFIWMRNVTKEEAENCLANWKRWAKTAAPNPNYKRANHQVGDWIFQKKPISEKEKKRNAIEWSYLNPLKSTEENKSYEESTPPKNKKDKTTMPSYENNPSKVQSLTPNAIQLNWKNPVEFPYCPQHYTGSPLETYMSNLKKGRLFSTNSLGDSYILDFGISMSDTLWVMCKIKLAFKTHAITKITYKDGIFYHENMGVFDIGDEPEIVFYDYLNANDTETI